MPAEGAISATFSALVLASNFHFHEQHKASLCGLTRSSQEVTSTKVITGTSQGGRREGKSRTTHWKRKVQMPCINKHSRGRIREGFKDLTLRGAERGAPCAFEDLSLAF